MSISPDSDLALIVLWRAFNFPLHLCFALRHSSMKGFLSGTLSRAGSASSSGCWISTILDSARVFFVFLLSLRETWLLCPQSFCFLNGLVARSLWELWTFLLIKFCTNCISTRSTFTIFDSFETLGFESFGDAFWRWCMTLVQFCARFSVPIWDKWDTTQKSITLEISTMMIYKRKN